MSSLHLYVREDYAEEDIALQTLLLLVEPKVAKSAYPVKAE
jgi:hypothetical protein